MPPRRHHHHHHRPGGGFIPPFVYPYAYPYPQSPDVFVVSDPCSESNPVRGRDGKIYKNPCVARRYGQTQVTPLPTLSGFVDDLTSKVPGGMLGVAALAVGGVLLYQKLNRRR